MKSKVFYTSMRATPEMNLLKKLEILLEKVGISEIINPGELVAIKLHFGEPGNLAFIRPQYVRVVVDKVKSLGGKPFLTDTNTLYHGKRSNAVDHIESALLNGFSYTTVGAPIVIADGLRGNEEVEVEVNLKHIKKAKIGSAIVYADALIALTHFKGHVSTGFGGTLKNVGMGCASRSGKLEQHSTSKPYVDEKRCVACGVCEKNCPVGAIKVEKHAVIDYDVCIGCGECVAVCIYGGMNPRWDESSDILSEKIAEYAYAVMKIKKDKCIFVSFIIDVSPDCDCASWNDLPIVPNLGILASKDPVALDQACVDLVNKAPVLIDPKAQGDPFKFVHPNVDWRKQLEHGEEIGLGSREYELVKIGV